MYLMRFIYKKVKEYLTWIRKNIKQLVAVIAGVAVFAVILFIFCVILAPRNFPVGRIVTIPEGATLSEISKLFEERAIIKSPLFFEALVRLSSKEKDILAGDYFFESSLSATGVAKKIINGEYGVEPLKMTIPEGSTILDIAALFCSINKRCRHGAPGSVIGVGNTAMAMATFPGKMKARVVIFGWSLSV